ncbi:MAG TPA: NAD(P)/FAD-dependent oxidoreductase [Rhizomicrobium sp.]
MAALQYPIPATRRALLGSFAALGAGALAFKPSRGGASDVDVVIVGAGASGIGAALELKQAGLSCRILEAADRVGGRALTDNATFRKAAGKPVPFDIGCAWIHRYRDGDPFAEWSRKLHFDTQAHDLEVNRLFYGATPYGDAMVKLEIKDEEILKERMENAPDVAASTIVPNWRPPMDAAATYMGPMDMAVDFDDMSTTDYARMADYEYNYLVREGYGTLVKMVALMGNLDVALATPVTAIDTSGAGVKVTTGGRRPGTINAKAVIVTVSTGVLAAETIKFTPPLPAQTQSAIDDVPMGLLVKIPLQIPGIGHYIDGIRPYDNVLQENPGLDDIYFLAWPWDSDLMVGFVGGKFGWDLSKHGQPAAVDFAKQKLAEIFGSDIKRRVARGLLTPWALNPLTRGAYSAAKPGKFASRAVLGEPIMDRLFLAGEATAPDGMFATCSGAYMAGTDAAAKIAALVKAG